MNAVNCTLNQLANYPIHKAYIDMSLQTIKFIFHTNNSLLFVQMNTVVWFQQACTCAHIICCIEHTTANKYGLTCRDLLCDPDTTRPSSAEITTLDTGCS